MKKIFLFLFAAMLGFSARAQRPAGSTLAMHQVRASQPAKAEAGYVLMLDELVDYNADGSYKFKSIYTYDDNG